MFAILSLYCYTGGRLLLQPVGGPVFSPFVGVFLLQLGGDQVLYSQLNNKDGDTEDERVCVSPL